MKNKNHFHFQILGILAITLIVISSCKKDEETPAPQPAVYQNYSALKAGNYWVYDVYIIEPDGNETFMRTDSCWIVKDTVINGNTYYEYANFLMNEMNSYLRDSMHYVVQPEGDIIFSSQVFDTIFKTYYTIIEGDTIIKTTTKMTDKNLLVNVPSGEYETYNYQISIHLYNSLNENTITRIRNTRYAKNIGIVKQDILTTTSNPNKIQRRLVRYHVD